MKKIFCLLEGEALLHRFISLKWLDSLFKCYFYITVGLCVFVVVMRKATVLWFVCLLLFTTGFGF